MIIKNLTKKELGYLFGLFKGDGYSIHDKKSRHYHVEFYLNSKKDKDISAFLVNLLKKLTLNPNEYNDKRYNCKRVRVYSKKLFNFIRKKLDITKKSNDFKLGFVSGLIDADGYVNHKKSTIMIVNTNKKLLQDCKEALDSLSVKSSLVKRKPCKKDKLNSYRMLISVSFKNLSHISNKIKRVGIP